MFQFPLFQNLTELGGIRYNDSTHYIQIKDGDTWYNYKYFNPSEPVDLIPFMTSNTTPEGIASASSVYENHANYQPWNAMSGTISSQLSTDVWMPTLKENNSFLQYNFDEAPTQVTEAEIVFATYHVSGDRTFKIQGSSDGSTWNDISDIIILLASECSQSASYTAVTKRVQLAPSSYRYYRIAFLSQLLPVSSGDNITNVAQFQLLGFE